MRGFFGYILAAGFAAAAVLVLLAGHDTQKPGEPPSAARDDWAGVRLAAESGIRLGAKNPDAVRFRGEQVYPQAAVGQIAVCGQADVLGGPSQMFVPFVALIGAGGGSGDPVQR